MSQAMDEMIRRARQRTAERDRGAPGSVGFRTLFTRTADLFIPSANRLPVDYHNDSIQAPDGKFYYIEGYSDPAGGDIMPPVQPIAGSSAPVAPLDSDEDI